MAQSRSTAHGDGGVCGHVKDIKVFILMFSHGLIDRGVLAWVGIAPLRDNARCKRSLCRYARTNLKDSEETICEVVLVSSFELTEITRDDKQSSDIITIGRN